MLHVGIRAFERERGPNIHHVARVSLSGSRSIARAHMYARVVDWSLNIRWLWFRDHGRSHAHLRHAKHSTPSLWGRRHARHQHHVWRERERHCTLRAARCTRTTYGRSMVPRCEAPVSVFARHLCQVLAWWVRIHKVHLVHSSLASSRETESHAARAHVQRAGYERGAEASHHAAADARDRSL